MSDILTVSNVTAGYGKLTIVRDVTFGVPAGTALGILGQNGAGKSTLLKTIAGLLPCSAGTIALDGQSIQGVAAFRRVRAGLALVPEGRQIFGELTVEENLRIALNARARSAPAALDEVYSLFPMLKERRLQDGASLSGGQQQMLAIGRALVTAPRVLMLDEPTQGLAPVVVVELRAALQKLKQRFSMVIVEQNKEFLDGLADAVLRMENGRIQGTEEGANGRAQ